MLACIMKIMRDCANNEESLDWTSSRKFRWYFDANPHSEVCICFIRSFVNSRRVEQRAWSIDVDSISNVHPSIQADYYNIESRRGTRISYFRVFYRRLFSMLCESLQIVFWTVSFVCRISPASSTMYVHTHARARSSRICISIVHTHSIRQRDELPLFFFYTSITFVDLAIFLVEFLPHCRDTSHRDM